MRKDARSWPALVTPRVQPQDPHVRAFVDVVVRTKLNVTSAKEFTEPRDLTFEKGPNGADVRLRVNPGDVQVVGLTMK